MYTESAGSRKTIGDVDVVYHEGVYHLFHLVLPNHDFIAHAVSDNCLTWRRVENALFLGQPGSWDDSMLWTMHVSPNPHRPGTWRMFYTGLSRRDHGQIQRIGLAESEDLYTWRKTSVNWVDQRSELPYELPGRPPQPPFDYDPESCFPLGPDGDHYELKLDQGRHWISWRDPFYYRDNDSGFLLVAGRVRSGPIVRRGCVAVMDETRPNYFEHRQPIHHPGLYDDIEVPNLIKIDGEYYLIGSMREDAKIRYWHTEDLKKPWRSYADNVLLGTGNYAGRVTEDDNGFLLWSFFTQHSSDRTKSNLMPPPKRLSKNAKGHLEVRTFEGFNRNRDQQIEICELRSLGFDRLNQSSSIDGSGNWELANESGFQIFATADEFECFRLNARLRMLDEGKCGIVFRLDEQSHDGYYLSLDLFKGVAQMRAWGSGPDGSGEDMMQFDSLQAGYWEQSQRGEAILTLLAYGSYIELSIGSRVILSLADQTFRRGVIGFYVESARLQIEKMNLETLSPPIQTDEHLANG